jgi:hypothetical protein
MKTKLTILILLLIFKFLFYCSDTSTNSGSNSDENNSIIGRIIDRASNLGNSGSLVKIVNDKDAYQETTDINGNFSFTNVNQGDYQLIVVNSSDLESITDTVGIYSTTNPDWGDIYTETFASIHGTIFIEGLSDHSFVNVQLLGTDKSALTTNQGRFRIDFIFPDLYDLFISVADQNYSSYHIKDINLNVGDTYTIDTLLTFKFRDINLRAATEVVLPRVLGTNFSYADGKYWYGKSIEGLYSYDPLTEEETLVFSHYFLGDPKVVFDYNTGVWCTGDQATEWMHRKYSISEDKIIDSVRARESFTTYSIAWDSDGNNLVSHASLEMNLLSYSTSLRQLMTISPLLEYDPKEYDSIRFYDIHIGENGTVYTLIRYKPSEIEEQLHLYIFNNLTDLNTIQIYKFPSLNFSRICYKEGKIYIIQSGGQIFEIVLD